MPRLKPPPAKPEEEQLIEDSVPPQGNVEIELAGDEPGETVVELAPQPAPAPVVKTEPEAEDNPLQKALDAQKHAEELQRAAQRERDAALARERERSAELERAHGEREDAEYNSVLTAIAAEQSALDKAEADYAAFAALGDWTQAAKAQRVIGSAAARLDRLEDGKQNFDTRREAAKTASPERREPRGEPLDFESRIAKMPDSAKSWLRQHPEFINDTALNTKIGAVHNYLVQAEAIEPFTPAYFEALDQRLGLKPKPEAKPEPDPQAQPQRRSMPVSAPVSRDVPSATGQRPASTKVTLNEEERRIARNSFTSDMTDAQKELLYARNKQKLHRMRANGEYRHTTEETG